MGKMIKTRKVEDPNKAGGVNHEKAWLDTVPAVSSLRSGGSAKVTSLILPILTFLFFNYFF